MFNKLCIIGVGLIGGSVAMAARERGLSRHIVGLGRHEDLANLESAKALGVIDEFYLDVGDAVANVDCIVIATPVGSVEAVLHSLQPHWNAETLYTDVGSTKTNVLAAAKKIFSYLPENFVPAHPIAGAEQSGVGAAVADLFVGKRLIITPELTTNEKALQTLTMFWQGLGSEIAVMAADHHDAILAATSHLPHILAFALVDLLGHRDEQSEIFQYAAGGFRDFTRIASSDPAMWRDICLANKTQILPLIQQLKQELDKIQRLIETNDDEQLFATFTYAGKARQRFLDLFNS